jgi:asparagine synthase (glutamine-hydrolysing)
MCGILAVIDRPGNLRVADELFSRALDLLRHRGPDDLGIWSDDHARLGHRRLSIIDLGPGGHQPMMDPQTGVTITFNGEIFNYIELRDELRTLKHTFSSQSDTEVLLRAYLAWGVDCLHRLNGMWHFVIWDPRDCTAFIARDRLGVKPSYYALSSRRLIVASEPKAILAIEPDHRRVDESALRAFLVHSALYTKDRSFYQGVHVLLPAHRAIFWAQTGEIRIQRYWTPNSQEISCESSSDIDKFVTLVGDSVRLRMRSDVPVGLTLSGGLDSTAILTEAVKHTKRLTAFTSTYLDQPSAGEEKWARLAARKYNNVDLNLIDARTDDWIHTLRKIAWHMDGPGYSPAVFPLWRIMEQARASGIPVLLEGQGADELLGGYLQYAALDTLGAVAQAARKPSAARLKELVRTVQRYSQTFSFGRLGLNMVRERVPNLLPAYRSIFGALGTLRREFIGEDAYFAREPGYNDSVHARLLSDLQHEILPGLLQYGDAISMAHSIENRLPFLDYRVVEFCVSLPLQSKIGNGQTKRILREMLVRAGQQEIAHRRDKKGYPTAIHAWLQARNGEIPRQLLLAPNARIHQYCEPARLQRLVDMHFRGVPGRYSDIYRLISAEIWLQECL